MIRQASSPEVAEREALARLPALLSDLLDEPTVRLDEVAGRSMPGSEADLAFVDHRGRRWEVVVKSSAGPARIAEAADQWKSCPPEEGVRLLVVPYMTTAGAEAALGEGVNWLDLAGNADIRAEDLYVHVEGRPSVFRSPGRPASPFAPRSARVTRLMLRDPSRWWRQRDLAKETGLDDGHVSRIVRRLVDERFVAREQRLYRPSNPGAMLDAWAEEYRFDRHDVVLAHMTGGGVEGTRELSERLSAQDIDHAFTGLSAAWAFDRHARYRLSTVFVAGDPRRMLAPLELRRVDKGANVQLVCPNDDGVFQGAGSYDELVCVAPPQAYLDLLHLPERAPEAADHLRSRHLRWDG